MKVIYQDSQDQWQEKSFRTEKQAKRFLKYIETKDLGGYLE